MNLASGWGPDGNRPTHGRVLGEPQMRSVFVVVTYVFRHESFQVSFIQYDHMVQHVAATTPYPTLGDSVLPGTPKCGANRLTPKHSGRIDHVSAELSITIKQQELLSPCVWPGFAHLLHDPQGTGILRNIAAQNSPAIVINEEEAIQDPEGKGGHGEEVHGGNGFAMVSQEGQPSLGHIWTARRSLQPA